MKKTLQEFKKKKFLSPKPDLKKYGENFTNFFCYPRVIFVGTSRNPYDGNVKDIKRFFDKFFYFPFPNYSDRKHLMSHFLK